MLPHFHKVILILAFELLFFSSFAQENEEYDALDDQFEATISFGLSTPFAAFRSNNPSPGEGTMYGFAKNGLVRGMSLRFRFGRVIGTMLRFESGSYEMDGERYFEFVQSLRSYYDVTYTSYQVGTYRITSFLPGCFLQSRMGKLTAEFEVTLGLLFINTPEIRIEGKDHFGDHQTYLDIKASSLVTYCFSPGISLRYPIFGLLHVYFTESLFLSQYHSDKRYYPDSYYVNSEVRHNYLQIYTFNTTLGISLRF